jgi:hypothetical protein
MRMVLNILVFASFLVLASPIHADGTDDASTEGIEAPGDSTAQPVETQPPAEPIEEDEGKSD